MVMGHLRVLAAIVAAGLMTVVAWAQEPRVPGKQATRVAVLNVGPVDSSVGPLAGDLLNVTVRPEALKRAAEELVAEKPNVVVLRINSRGGPDSAAPFMDVIEKEFRPRFRTVAWVKRAEREAGLVAFCVPELCMMSDGVLSAQIKPWRWTHHGGHWFIARFDEGARAAALGGRSPLIMRSMQGQAPLSLSLTGGERVLSQDVKGERVISDGTGLLALNAKDARVCEVSLGVANDGRGLCDVLGIQHVVWVGGGVATRLDKEAERAASAYLRVHDALFEWEGSRAAQQVPVVDRGAAGRARAAARTLQQTEAEWPGLAQWAAELIGSFDLDRMRREQREELAKAEKDPPTRVAVLHIGPSDDKGGGSTSNGSLGFDMPVEPYAAAADELEKLGVQVVVLRFNCGVANLTGVKAALDVLERSYFPRFRTVAWVGTSVGGSSIVAMAIPELYMTTGYGMCGYHAHRRSAPPKEHWEELRRLVERGCLMGNRPFELSKAMHFYTPLSMSFLHNERKWLENNSGDRVLSRGDRTVSIRAEDGLLYGQSRGTAHTREELAKAMGLGSVEWTGAEIDQRVQAQCREAKNDIEKIVEEGFKAVLAYNVMKSNATTERRGIEEKKRDAAWAEVVRLRKKWPTLSQAWPGLFVTLDWDVRGEVTWEDVARRIGMAEPAKP
jgi:hypothetical protein